MEREAAEVERRAVVGRVPRAHAVAQEAVELVAPLGLGVVVRGEAPWQEAHALDPLGRVVVGGDRVAEPAERASRKAAQDDARLPCLAHDLVDPVCLPHAEQADEAAAADVDQVLREEVLADARDRAVAAEEA